MIILTATQAARLRGYSPSNRRAALNPIPLKDGTYFLGDEVLSDPNHVDVRALLQSATQVRTIDPSLMYSSSDADLATVRSRMGYSGTRTG